MDDSKNELCSVIVPCYNEADSLLLFYDAIAKVSGQMEPLAFEFIFVDDGSRDRTLDMIKDLHKKDPRVRYLSFSRNFGKEAAMYAGFQHAKGDYVAVMDADLQDPPEMLPQMYRIVTAEGYDSVATCRKDRKGEPPIRSFFAKRFYKLMNRISGTGIVDGARDFRFMKREVVDAILSMTEYNRFSKGIFEWVGFRTKYLSYENINRIAGDSKWSFWKLFKYSLEGIVAFSTAPLALASAGGILLCFVSFCVILFLILRAFIYGDPVPGWPSMVCIIIFVGGLQLFCNGIIGMYLSRAYLESKNRPIYIIQEQDEIYLSK